MYISVDIFRLKNHVTILHEELRVAQSIVDTLSVWYNQASVDGSMELGFIQWHLNVAQNQVTYIQGRISLLETAADKLSAVKLETDNLLSDAKDAVTSSFF